MHDKNIRLHKTLGINCRMTFCPVCEGDGEELALLGYRNWKQECKGCGRIGFAMDKNSPCDCGAKAWGEKVTLTDYERIPGTPCKACQQKRAEMDEAVREGGVYFQCDAGCFGAIQKNEFAEDVRARTGIQAPNPVGVKFPAEDCPLRDSHTP